MEAKEKILEMLERISALKKSDKTAIRKMCEEAGLGCKFETRCPDCYRDALLVLRQHYGISGKTCKPNHGWRYTKDYTTYWRGHLLCETTPVNVIEEVVKYHPQFFERVEE